MAGEDGMSFNLRRTGCSSFIAPGSAISVSKISKVWSPIIQGQMRVLKWWTAFLSMSKPAYPVLGVIGGEIQELRHVELTADLPALWARIRCS